MGKMKELFMQIHYPNGVDLEREYLVDDLIAQEQSYLEYQKLKKEPEINILNTKIEVANGNTTRIEIGTEDIPADREFAFM